LLRQRYEGSVLSRTTAYLCSPVQNCLKFSAVFGATSANSSILIRPAGSPPTVTSAGMAGLTCGVDSAIPASAMSVPFNDRRTRIPCPDSAGSSPKNTTGFFGFVARRCHCVSSGLAMAKPEDGAATGTTWMRCSYTQSLACIAFTVHPAVKRKAMAQAIRQGKAQTAADASAAGSLANTAAANDTGAAAKLLRLKKFAAAILNWHLTAVCVLLANARVQRVRFGSSMHDSHFVWAPCSDGWSWLGSGQCPTQRQYASCVMQTKHKRVMSP
jgi:hypothetical protein